MDFVINLMVVFTDNIQRIKNSFVRKVKSFEEYDKHVYPPISDNEPNKEFVPIVVYPHAVSRVLTRLGAQDELVKEYSKHYKLPVAIFGVGQERDGLVLGFGAYFADKGKLLAECTKSISHAPPEMENSIPDLNEVCKVFPFTTDADKLRTQWSTLGVFEAAKMVGNDLGIDIHGEDMMSFLENKCKLTKQMELGAVYKYLG